MKRSLCLGLFIVCFLGLAATAHAANANFQGNCAWNSSYTKVNCVFDALRPSSDPSSCSSGVPEYFWNFGDGGSVRTYSSTVSHSYNPPPSGQYGYTVSLSVFCDEGSDDASRPLCISGFGYPGCIFLGGSWY
jgi:hypothetical protein